MIVGLGYLVLFQSKHSCFWCSLISVSVGQHVSTRFYFWVIIRSLLSLYVEAPTICSIAESRKASTYKEMRDLMMTQK